MGVIFGTFADVAKKLNGFVPSCTSALGGGVDSRNEDSTP
jgi:hypothetical protein